MPDKKFGLDRSVMFHVNRLSHKGRSILLKCLKPWGITAEQATILQVIYEEGGLSQRQLADKSLKDAPNTTRLVDKLEESGLLVRKSDPSDRRSYKIYATDKGRELIERINPVMNQGKELLSEGFSTEEYEGIVETLEHLYTNLENMENRFVAEFNRVKTA